MAATDAALTPVGLIGLQAQTHAWARSALVPLLGVLASVFAGSA